MYTRHNKIKLFQLYLYTYIFFKTRSDNMALRLLGNPLKRTIVPFGNRAGHSVASVTPKIGPDGVATEHHIYGTQIGTRDIVGFGWNGAYFLLLNFDIKYVSGHIES